MIEKQFVFRWVKIMESNGEKWSNFIFTGDNLIQFTKMSDSMLFHFHIWINHGI